jgi:hypothetical protein
MNREVHVLVLREPQGEIPWGYSPGDPDEPERFTVRFCESLRVQCPEATHPPKDQLSF